MADICDTCAFEDACPSAHFHPTGRNICADCKPMGKVVLTNGLLQLFMPIQSKRNQQRKPL